MRAVNNTNPAKEHSLAFGVIWDMDGVILDTGDFHYQAWVPALAEVGLPFSRETFRKTFGMTNPDILALLLGDTPPIEFVSRVSDRKEQEFRRIIRGHARLLPGVMACLERNQLAGALQAVASSAPQENIDLLIDELDLHSYFMALLSAFNLPGKPDPAVFLEAARRIDLPPDRCIVIEDAIVGVEAARRAGMKCIAVTTTNPAAALSDADVVVNRLDELPPDAFLKLLT